MITGAGPTFSVGADLTVFAAGLDTDRVAVLAPILDGVHEVISQLRQLPMPVVAAVNGVAAGAGMAIALAADLRVVSRSTRFVPAYLQIGCSPDGGMTHVLARTLGTAQTMSLLVRGHVLDADELHSAGLAEAIAADDTVLAAGMEPADTLRRLPTRAVVATRELLDAAPTRNLTDQLHAEAIAVTALWKTDDLPEGVTAFLDKRTPTFTGR